jgi:hypothetical protein
MVDDVRVEKPPTQIVWLSSNCCDLTPASQQPQKRAPVPDNKVREQAVRPRLLELLKRARRAG